MYGVLWVGFYVCAHAELSLYVDSYEELEVYDVYEVGFCLVCLNASVQD